MATTSSDLYGEYVTVCETNENTVFEMNGEGNLLASHVVEESTESRTAAKPGIKSKTSTPGTRSISDVSGPGYVNVTEVPTDSGLGVYHVVPWGVTPTRTKPNIGDNHEAGISEDEYNALQFDEDRTGQEDEAATYHHLQHE